MIGAAHAAATAAAGFELTAVASRSPRARRRAGRDAGQPRGELRRASRAAPTSSSCPRPRRCTPPTRSACSTRAPRCCWRSRCAARWTRPMRSSPQRPPTASGCSTPRTSPTPRRWWRCSAGPRASGRSTHLEVAHDASTADLGRRSPPTNGVAAHCSTSASTRWRSSCCSPRPAVPAGRARSEPSCAAATGTAPTSMPRSTSRSPAA